MAHFARVLDGIVQEVIVAEQSYIDNLVYDKPGKFIKTSYNTVGGVHYSDNSRTIPSEDQSKALRKNFAGPGYHYDKENDAFYGPQPHNSWTLNTTTFIWEPPVAYPDDGNFYHWNEETTSWDLVS